MENYFSKIAGELNITVRQAAAVGKLLDEGATVPFIARYRKEMTGNLDEVAIMQIRDRLEQLRELDKRREAILKSLEEQEKLTKELENQVNAALTLSELEDIYLPYRPKRRTRAMIAREKGLEPLADLIFAQSSDLIPDKIALTFINEEKGVADSDEALAGARDIIAEKINEDRNAREDIRRLFVKEAVFRTKVISGKEEEGQKYKDYFKWEEPISKAPSHRVLAMRRAEKELIISLDASAEEDAAIELLKNRFVKGNSLASRQTAEAITDGYKRLLAPSMETEIRMSSKQGADDEAIRVFAENLRELLLAAPLGQKRILAVDPGFRSGCKIVALDENGKFLASETIYPHPPQRQAARSTIIVDELLEKYKFEAIAVGNGTAGRETEQFFRDIKIPNVPIVMVNESGASIYSASEIAREEFPDLDLTVRGSISIGRRLADPLSELVKLDPKSIGVGQYQHDVDQPALKKSLDDVVVSCVNAVGVELNTAGKQLLTYVSGLGPGLAQNIVEYRNQNGEFKSREELKKVSRLGPKAFEQAAGFLRIRNGINPLDSGAVHPESYGIVQKMVKDLGCTTQDLMTNDTLRKKIDPKKYVSETVGLPTLQDILDELAKPGRDPREKFELFSFAEGVEEPEDLKIGMKLPAIITNVTNFGAFADIGVHQDGLIHLSQMADRFIKHPSEVVKVGMKVEVTVTEVDLDRKRIALSMKKDPFGEAEKHTKSRPKVSRPPAKSSAARPATKSVAKPAVKPRPKAAPKKTTQADMNDMLAQLRDKFKK